MADEISPTGKWIDTNTGRVVDTEPAEGRLLVAPGGPITPDVAARIARAEAEQPPAPEPEPVEDNADVDDEVETATVPTERETTTTPSARKRASSR